MSTKKNEISWKPQTQGNQPDSRLPHFLQVRDSHVEPVPVSFASLASADSLSDPRQTESADLAPSDIQNQESAGDQTSNLSVKTQSVSPTVPAQAEQPGPMPEQLSQIASLGVLLDQIRRESRSMILDLAICLAERILVRNIADEPEWILRNAQNCIDNSVPNGPIKMRVNPADKERIIEAELSPAWIAEKGGSVKLVADPELSLGDCVIESERARIDGRINIQLEQLRKVLEDTVAGGLFDEEP